MRPDAQLKAGHIPAADYERGVRSVVVVEAPAPRSYLGPLLLIITATAGTLGTVYVVLALLDVAAQVATAVSAAVPSGVGVSIALRKRTR
jgi:hypothetical protein